MICRCAVEFRTHLRYRPGRSRCLCCSVTAKQPLVTGRFGASGRERSFVRGDRGVDPCPALRARSWRLGEGAIRRITPAVRLLDSQPTAMSSSPASSIRFRSEDLRRADPGSGLIVKGRVLKAERWRIWLLID